LDFHPKILKKSENIVRSKEAAIESVSMHSGAASVNSASRSNNQRRSSSKFDSLYQDAKRRNERQLNIYSACLDAECTFKPELEAKKPRFSNSDGYLRVDRGERSELFERLSQGMSSSRERS